jgi:hypothetical protein
MKTKNILGLVAIVAVAVAMAFNVTVSNKKTDTASLLALKNVEALASGEVGTGARTCSLSWTVSIFGVSTTKSCSVTCDAGFNAVCELKECKCVAV